MIELDGSQHRDKHQYDAQRTEYLETQGYAVVRFWNSDVREQIEVVVEKIRRALERGAVNRE